MNNNIQDIKLKRDDLTILRDLHHSQVYLCNLNGREVVYKEPREDEREYEVAEIVNRIIEAGYNKKFKVLKLPKFYEIDKTKGYLLMEYCGNNDYLKKEWESGGGGGGSSMDLRLSMEMARIIYDFSKIQLKDLDDLSSFSFNFLEAREIFLNKLRKIYEEGFINEVEFNKSKSIINKRYSLRKFIFNNGDYYPRNMIPADGKVWVVDWQSWDGDFRANIVDTVENIASFAFIHMWENKKWQTNFLKELRKLFFINYDNLRLSLMMKSLDQFVFFGKDNVSAKKQLELFKRVLNNDWFLHLWKGSTPEFKYVPLKLLRYLQSIF